MFIATQSPTHAYEALKQEARQVLAVANNAVTEFAAGADIDRILGVHYALRFHRGEMNRLRQIPGVVQHAKDEENDQAYDVVAEYQAMSDAIDAFTTEVETSLPDDADNYVLGWKLGNGTEKVPRNFSAGALATLSTLAQAVADSITE